MNDVITVLLPKNATQEDVGGVLALLAEIPDFEDRLEIEVVGGIPTINFPAIREQRIPAIDALNMIFPAERFPRAYALSIRTEHLEEESILIDPGMLPMFQEMERRSGLGLHLRATIAISEAA